MKISVYTSCSSNYLPKARVLADTLKAYHPEAKLALLLCDTPPAFVDFTKEKFDYVWQPKDMGYDAAFEFEHNVMELCTAVKGRGLVKLWDHEPDSDLILYLDPDVVVYHDLAPMLDYLGDNEIGLVPHITAPEAFDRGVTLTELSVVRHGTYNLGHLILRPGKHSREMAQWWADRLDKYCFDDPESGLFTDQRWCDLVPAIFDKVSVLRQPNMDVASWNAGSRELIALGGGQYEIDGYPLLTYHFSGTGPNGTHKRVRESLNPSNGAQAEIEREYEADIARHGQAHLARWPFAGDYFEDGTRVSTLARRYYRRHKDLQKAFPNPFKDGYASWLRGNLPAAIDGIKLRPDIIEKAFNDLFDEKYYLDTYPDAAAQVDAGSYKNALDHYVSYGSDHFYDPNHYFVTVHYAERARYLGEFHQAPGSIRSTWLWHYLNVGIQNGIEPCPDFSSKDYFEMHPGMAESWRQNTFSTPFAHFVSFGDSERRAPSRTFNPEHYLASNPQAEALIESGCVTGPYGAYLYLGHVAGRPSRQVE